MDAQEKAEGRARVKEHLWDRLDQAGLQRPKGMTIEAYTGMQARLADRLAYMLPENLATLAEIVIDNPAPRGRCWSEVLLLGEAKALQTPPVTDLPIVTSWLASIEGPAALAGGFAVELFRHLRRTGRPPRPYDLTRIREEAANNARQIELVSNRQVRDVASAEDKAWLEAYRRDHERVRQIIAEGQARRDVKEAAE